MDGDGRARRGESGEFLQVVAPVVPRNNCRFGLIVDLLLDADRFDIAFCSEEIARHDDRRAERRRKIGIDPEAHHAGCSVGKRPFLGAHIEMRSIGIIMDRMTDGLPVHLCIRQSIMAFIFGKRLTCPVHRTEFVAVRVADIGQVHIAHA